MRSLTHVQGSGSKPGFNKRLCYMCFPFPRRSWGHQVLAIEVPPLPLAPVPLNICCMMTACPRGGGVGSPCSTSPRVVWLCWGFAEPGREMPGYLGMVSSWSRSSTYAEGPADFSPAVKLGCNMSPHPSSLSLQRGGMTSLPGNLSLRSASASFFLGIPVDSAALE